MITRQWAVSIFLLLHLSWCHGGGFFYVQNSPVPVRADKPLDAQQAPSAVLPSSLATLLRVPSTNVRPPSDASMWMKFSQDGQGVAYGYQLTDYDDLPPNDQFIRVPNPGYIIITKTPGPEGSKLSGAGNRVSSKDTSLPREQQRGVKTSELTKDASGIREVVVDAPGNKHQNEISGGEYQPAAGSDADYQDYYEYEYDDTDFPDAKTTQAEPVPPKSLPTPVVTAAPTRAQPTKESVLTTTSARVTFSTSVKTTPAATPAQNVQEVTTFKPATRVPVRDAKAIDTSPAYDVIRVGAAYATDVKPKMKAPASPNAEEYDDFYTEYEDSSEFVDADDPITSEITHLTAPITSKAPVTTRKPTTTTTTAPSTRKPTTTTTLAPTTRRPTTTTTKVAALPAQEEYDYYEDDEEIPPALKHLHGEEYAFKPTAEDEPILSQLNENQSSATTPTTTTTTTTTTTSTTPTTTTTTTTTTTPPTTTTTTPPPTTSTLISTKKRVSSVTSSVGRTRRPRIRTTTSTTTTEQASHYDDDEPAAVNESTNLKTELEEPKAVPADETLQRLTLSTSSTAVPLSAASEVMRPTTYRPKIDISRLLTPTASQVATSPVMNGITKAEEKEEGSNNAEEDDSSSWLGELLQFPRAVDNSAKEVTTSSTESTSTTTAAVDTMLESSSAVSELVVEEITKPAIQSTSTTEIPIRGPARGGRRKPARIRVAIRRQFES